MRAEIGICRCEKIRARAGMAARDGHNRRSKPVANADPGRRTENRNLRPDLPATSIGALDAVLDRLGNPTLRKNGILGIEYVMAFSPEAAARIDPEGWGKSALAFVEDRHGRENILSACLHLDEKTPHVHVVAAPVFAGALVVGPFMGNRTALRKLQDDFYERVSSRFCLARRSEKPTGRAHIPARVLRAESQEVSSVIIDAKHRLEKAAQQMPVRLVAKPVPTMSLLSMKGRDEFVRSIEQTAESRMISFRNQILKVAAATFDELREYAANAAILREENRAMKSSQLQEFRDIDLAQVAERILGFPGRREGVSSVWETDAHKLVVTAGKFKDFKAEQGALGGGAIDLTMHLLGCGCAEALRVLAADFPAELLGAARSHHLRLARSDAVAAAQNPKRMAFEELLARFAQPDTSKLQRVRNYLETERGLPAEMVARVIEGGNLWANRWGSCVFAHRDLSGSIRGCSIRATQGPFKQTLGDKTNAWFPAGASLQRASRLILTESPIDALSFAAVESLGESDAAVSTAGQCDTGPLVALRRPLLLAQDNDPAGELQATIFADAARVAGITIERRVPARGKDWNEFLTITQYEHRRIEYEIGRREQAASGIEREALEREQRADRTTETSEAELRPDRPTLHPDGHGFHDRRRGR